MKKNIAIVTGGYSSEYVISVQSAQQVKNNLNSEKYNLYIVEITRDKWFCKINEEEFPIDKNDFTIKKNDEVIRFDGVFMSIHGAPGEDGKLQAYFDMINLPYTTSPADSLMISFNKYFTKKFAEVFGIKSAPSVILKKGDAINIANIIKITGIPCFVKPNNAGSSFGVTKVNTEDALEEAIVIAFKEDNEVLIEKNIEGAEITCGLCKTHKDFYKFPITEVVSKKEFFDYEAKYTPGLTDEITPARISKENEAKCKQLSSLLYKELNCKGLVRIDYIISKDDMYLLEMNTVPGMSKNSIIPQQIRAFGKTESEIYNELIESIL